MPPPQCQSIVLAALIGRAGPGGPIRAWGVDALDPGALRRWAAPRGTRSSADGGESGWWIWEWIWEW